MRRRKKKGRGIEPFPESGICFGLPHFFPKLLSKEGGTGVDHGFFQALNREQT